MAYARFAGAIQAAVLALEIAEAEQLHGFLHRAAFEVTHKRADGRGDAGNGADAAGNFFNIDAGKGWCYGHGALTPLSAIGFHGWIGWDEAGVALV